MDKTDDELAIDLQWRAADRHRHAVWCHDNGYGDSAKDYQDDSAWQHMMMRRVLDNDR